MDVPGPCAQCGRPARLRTCGLCGKHHCADCAPAGRHACASGSPRGSRAPGDLFSA